MPISESACGLRNSMHHPGNAGYYWLAVATRSATHAGYCRLHPIQSFETGLKFVDWLNRAIGPFGLYFPILAIFKDHTKYRSSRRHVFTYPHMMARRE